MVRFYALLFLFVINFTNSYAQHGLYPGVSIEGGFPSHSFGADKKILKSQFPSYHVGGGFVVQYRAFNHIGLEIGINQNYQSWNIEDKDFKDRHPGYESTIKNKQSYYSYYGAIQYLQPISEKTSLLFGVGYNFNNIGKKSLSSQKEFAVGNETVNVSSDYASQSNSIIGEVGVQRFINKNILTVSIKSSFGQADVMKGSYTITSGGNAVASDEFSSKGSYVGLNLKYTFQALYKEKKTKEPRQKTRKDKGTKNPEPQPAGTDKGHEPPKILEGRTVKIDKIITVKSDSISVLIWDHQEVDGDRVSLYLNNQWILTDYTLEKKQKELKLHLVPGKNIFILHALNLGKFAPNTAAVLVNDGKSLQQLIMESTMEESGTIIINYIP